jgi:hypothetical protein
MTETHTGAGATTTPQLTLIQARALTLMMTRPFDQTRIGWHLPGSTEAFKTQTIERLAVLGYCRIYHLPTRHRHARILPDGRAALVRARALAFPSARTA